MRDTTTWKKTWEYIRADLDRYRVTDQRSYPAIFVMCPGAMAGMWYRIGYWIWHYEGSFKGVMNLMRTPYLILRRFVEIFTGIYISPRAEIGPGLYIIHFGCIFIGSTVIGSNCNIAQEVTLGVSGRGDKRGWPTLGDRVMVAAGAKIIGTIRVGNDAVVGANAVVTKPVPDRAVAVGNPARISSYKGSFDFIFYTGMDTDPERLESLALSERADSEEVGRVPLLAH